MGQSYEEWKGEHNKESKGATTFTEKTSRVLSKIWDKIKKVAKAQAKANAVYGRTPYQYTPKPRKEVILPPKEYAHVMNEVGTWYDKRFTGKSKFRMAIGDYVYTFEVIGDHSFKVTGKRKIK